MIVALDCGTITVATAMIDLRVSLRTGNLWSESGCPRRCWRRRNRGTGGRVAEPRKKKSPNSQLFYYTRGKYRKDKKILPAQSKTGPPLIQI
jgi:hypothetical protein